MSYMDFNSTHIPITAREASVLTRFSFLLIMLLLLPMLLFGQLSTQSRSFASLSIFPDIEGDGTGGETAEGPRSTENRPDVEMREAPGFAAAATTTALATSAINLRNMPPTIDNVVVGTSSRSQRTDLRTFSGARIRDVIQLTWSAVSAHDIVGFEIERRTQRTGSWERIGYLRPSHRSGNDYSFLDHLSGNGVMYYRLRQVRTDGRSIVSPIVSVTPDDVLESYSVWKHSTDAFKDYGTVSFGLRHAAKVKLTLIDRYGDAVKTILDYKSMAEGHHVIPFGTGRLAPGIYILRIDTGDRITNLIFLHS